MNRARRHFLTRLFLEPDFEPDQSSVFADDSCFESSDSCQALLASARKKNGH